MEVLDTVKNITTIYTSIGEAALDIGVTKTAIRKALNDQKEKGVPRAIKKRYWVKRINDNP